MEAQASTAQLSERPPTFSLHRPWPWEGSHQWPNSPKIQVVPGARLPHLRSLLLGKPPSELLFICEMG